SLGSPIRNAKPVPGRVAGDDLDAARRRPVLALQLDEDAVGAVVDGDAGDHGQALDRTPAADADTDARAAHLLAVVLASAVLRVDRFDHGVLQEVAAQSGARRVVNVEVAKPRAHEVLKSESFRERIVSLEIDFRAVDLEGSKGTVRQVVLPARAVLLRRERREHDGSVRFSGVGEHEARRARSRADEGDAAAPHDALIPDGIYARRAVDHARYTVRGVRGAELLDQRRQRRLVVRNAVTGDAVVTGVVRAMRHEHARIIARDVAELYRAVSGGARYFPRTIGV